MAYFNQEKKKLIAADMKALCKEYGVKGSLAVRDHMVAVLNISKGKIDFLNGFKDGYVQVNEYRIDKDFEGKAKEFLNKAFEILNRGNWDRSDVQVDYFDVGHYVDINIGQWNKDYKLEV